MLFSIELNPLHSLLIVAIITYPVLTILQMKDLKKIDPFKTLIRVKGEYEDDEVLPRGGMSTHTMNWETR